MKKYLITVAATLALAACNKETDTLRAPVGADSPGKSEITVNTATAMTKGYLTGTGFFDTAIEELHAGEGGAPSDVNTAREMRMSAYLTPQSGTPENYFVDFTFAKIDDNWHHTPAAYWPVGGTLDFLAYSSKTPFDAKCVTWNDKNAAESVVLDVFEDRTQDDIVFASAYGKQSADGAGPVAMLFHHTQAWIEFRIRVADEQMRDRIAIREIIIENAYDSGELTIARAGSEARAEWSFRHEQTGNILFEDNCNLYGSSSGGVLSNPLTEEVNYMDMLLPEQPRTSFVIRYSLAGQDKVLEYRYNLSATTAKWLMGEKYVYDITFDVNEISVIPNVKAYEDGDVTDLIPTEIK